MYNQNYGMPGDFIQPAPNHIKFENVLELIESDKIIEDIFVKMSGLQRTERQGQVFWIRARQPMFSDDYTLFIISTLRTYSNPVTTLTTWTKEEINKRLEGIMSSLLDNITMHGNDNFISQATWKKIITKHRQFQIIKVVEADDVVKEYKVSGWYEELNQDWNENAPVTSMMVHQTKDPLETFEQSDIFSVIWESAFIFIDASLRRSLEDLTLQYNNGMKSKSMPQQTNPQAQQQQGGTY